VTAPIGDILEITWIGVDGSQWNLLRGTEGATLAPKPLGLHLPTWTQQVATAARVPGRAYKGTVYGPRIVDLNIRIGDVRGPFRKGRAWRQLDEAFWQSMSPEVPGRLLIRSDTGGYRFLDLRMEAAPDPAYARDPSHNGVATYVVNLVSDSPFWQGFDVSQTFAYDVVPSNYYGGGAGTRGPPFYISASSSLSSATANNPGDREAYPRWTATGPGTFTFGTGGHLTTLPTLAAGQQILINADPNVSSVTDGAGNNFWPFLGAHDFTVPIAAGMNRPLSISVTGATYMATSMQVALTPLYMKAT